MRELSYTFIYIPVWIDLKIIYKYDIYVYIPDLHSSMDRFEVHIGKNLQIQIIYLHSSMDRFEVKLNFIMKGSRI